MTPPITTRIKICGLTREADVDAAVAAGADALGFVLYAPSPRAVTVARAAELARRLPPCVTPVLLFVNAQQALLDAAAEAVPHAVWQLHGDESPEWCARQPHLQHRAWWRAVRIPPPGSAATSLDLHEVIREYPSAQALLLDTLSPSYGGSGLVFDRSLVPQGLAAHIIISGGLTAHNVGSSMQQLCGCGQSLMVDVSSGVEVAKGIKDARKMHDFVSAVRMADEAALP